MTKVIFLVFLLTLVVISLIAVIRALALKKKKIKFSKGFLMSLPFSILIIVTTWATIFILYFFLIAKEHPKKMIFELAVAIIVWSGFFGKIVIKKPNIEKDKEEIGKIKTEEDKYEVGLASVGGEPVPYIYLPGRHCLWQNGFIDSGMIVLDATIGIFAHVFKGVPIFKIDNGGPNPTKVNAGVVDVTISFRRRLDYEDPLRALEFLKAGRMDGAEKALISRVDSALRDVIGGIDSKIVLEEKGDVIIPFVQERLLEGYSPGVDFLKDGLPDRFNIGLRFFEIVISDVKGEGEVATGAKVTAATFEAQADKVAAEAAVERLNLYKKAGVQGSDAVDLDLTNRGKANTTILRGRSSVNARRIVQPGQGKKKGKNQGSQQANVDDVVAFINQDNDVDATDPGAHDQDLDDEEDE